MKARRNWRRIASAGMLTAAGALVFATWPSAASADPAVRTAWWNTMSGGGQSAPEPTAPDGGLHVAVAPGEMLAFGAVLYDMPQDATATLELKLSGQGTPVLVACPTKDTSWKEGGNQPSDAAPAYDCSTRSFTGSVSSDGATATFLVDGSAETTPGELSLAILPYMTHDAPGGVGTELPVDSTQPFSVDIAKPDVSSLTVTSAPSTTGLGSSSDGASLQQPATNPASSSGSTSSGTSTTGTQVPPTLTAGPPAETAPVDAAPQVASPAAPAGSSGITPAAAGAPKLDNTAHNAALALLVLVAMAVIASGTTSMQRSPKLLGGAGHRGAGAAAAASTAAPVAVAMMAPLGVRGLGRFAKQRVAAPRPLV
jgi:hypothetical protein